MKTDWWTGGRLSQLCPDREGGAAAPGLPGAGFLIGGELERRYKQLVWIDMSERKKAKGYS